MTRSEPEHPHPVRKPRTAGGQDRLRHPRGWSREVSDVMTTSVVTVDRITPYKEIARLLAGHRISGLPVLKMGREVAGVVTEADLLAAQAGMARRLHASVTRSWWPRRQGHRHRQPPRPAERVPAPRRGHQGGHPSGTR